jgi:hypothetical protein
LVAIRNRLTRQIALPQDLPVAAVRVFDAEHSGAWQRLPGDLLVQVRSDGPAAIVKFGMGLLEVPTDEELGVPILSYHHGDPTHFRGRPAGFYEILSGAPTMGQVVQRLSNALDSGDVLASAETKLLPHSYRATLIEAYRHSPLLLARALRNCLSGDSVRPAQLGRNYRLPGNAMVLKFLSKQLGSVASRVAYGLLKEKHWAVATAKLGQYPDLASIEQAIHRPAQWQTLSTPAGYRFLADPFMDPDQGLLVEALNARSCRGEIVRVDGGLTVRLSGRGGHYSYPAPVKDGGRWYIVPEISDWSRPMAFPLGDHGLGDPIELRIPGNSALLDPTPYQHQGNLYLFANTVADGASVLRLWLAGSLSDEFVEHASSPIRISPNGARMAGGLCRLGPKLFRFGQDFRRGYGDGLTVFEVTRLDERDYREHPIRELRFDDCRGPHTLSLGRGEVAFDLFVARLSLLAGLRRGRDRRAARQS